VASNRRSLDLTDAYRTRLLHIGNGIEREARRRWPTIEQLDATDWPERLASELTLAQRQAIRLTAGYLGAYLRSETGRGTAPAIDSRQYAGLSRDGRPLNEALLSPLIGVRAKLKAGEPPNVALAYGLQRATRTVGFEATQAARDALIDAIAADERFEGFQRNVAGTCAACMALSGTSGPRFEVHPSCQCVPQPTVRGAADRFPLPTGASLFGALPRAEQDSAIGSEAAAAVREGADLKDFVGHSRLHSDTPDFITQAPIQEVATP
jgi:hypothetical protein